MRLRQSLRDFGGVGIDVLTSQEDGTSQLGDPALLDRATALGRVLFSQDKDLLAETARRQQTGEFFAGLVFSRQQTLTIGKMVADLELIAKGYDPPDIENRVEYLPL